jgi:hypothetical protein
MVRYAEPVVCESWCVILYQWSWIMERYAQPVSHPLAQRSHRDSQRLAQHSTTWFTTTSWPELPMIHEHWYSIAHHDPQTTGCAWIMVNNAVPVVMNHTVLCWASRCESRCERCASRCESWWNMLSQLLWITVWYANCCETLWTHNDWQQLPPHSSPWFTPTGT